MTRKRLLTFFFLNIWSFALLVFGVGGVFFSLFLFLKLRAFIPSFSYFFDLPLIKKVLVGLLSIALAIFFSLMVKTLFSARLLLLSYPDKLRKVLLLLKKNKRAFRADSFDTFMSAPCGRFVVRCALYKLKKTSEYRALLGRRAPFFTRLKENCTPKKVVIYRADSATL